MWALFWNAPCHQQSVILSMLSTVQGLCCSLIQRRGLNLPLCALPNYPRLPGKQSPILFISFSLPAMKLQRKPVGAFCCLVAEMCNFRKCSSRTRRPGTHHPCSPIPRPLPLIVQCYQNTSLGSVPTYHFQTFPERVQERRKKKEKEKPFPLALFTVVGGGCSQEPHTITDWHKTDCE